MSIFRVCKEDPLLRMIRKNFSAVPLRNPSQKYQPMTVFAWNKHNSDFIGELGYLLHDKADFEVPVKRFDTKDLKGNKTRKIDTELGLTILSGFLKELGMDSTPVAGQMDGVKQVSFSFNNVQILNIDKGQLGRMLKGCTLDTENLALRELKKSSKGKLMLIDSVFTSSFFSFNVEKTSNASFKLDLQKMTQELANGKAKAKVDLHQNKEISFTTEAPLSFALTCLPMQIDWQSGTFTGLGTTGSDVAALGEENETDWDPGLTVEMDDGELLEFDSNREP